MSIPQNFKCNEQQILSASNTETFILFTAPYSVAAPDLMIVNEGPDGAQIKLGSGNADPVAVVNASANGTNQVRVPNGVVMIIKKDAATYVSAVCESGQTAKLYFHAGEGQ
jgi:hypothetical protein